MATLGRRRAYGQHFLKDRNISQAIADAVVEEAKKNHCLHLLEIGPGRGAITEPVLSLLENNSDIKFFTLVEKDKKLADEWSQKSTQYSNIEFKVHSADFLNLDPLLWNKPHPVAVVSNLPYSSGTAILNLLASHRTKIPAMVLMFQAEVAKRLRAQVGTKEWGSLSIWIQNHWEVTRLIQVPPGAFYPPPEVQSEVVVLLRRDVPLVQVTDESLWQGLLRACFAHRRKMLRSSLKGQKPWQNALELSQLDGTKRAETLQWDEWQKLYNAALKS